MNALLLSNSKDVFIKINAFDDTAVISTPQAYTNFFSIN